MTKQANILHWEYPNKSLDFSDLEYKTIWQKRVYKNS